MLSGALDDIAAAGAVFRSRCCTLFQERIGQSPMAHLKRVRLQKSCDMLSGTDQTVTEIALACGFQTSSYFTYVFRNELGETPVGYPSRLRGNGATE